MSLNGGNGNGNRSGYLPTVIGCVLTAFLSYIVLVYGSQQNTQSQEIRDDDLAIAQLKISVANLVDEKRSREAFDANVQKTLTDLIGTLGNLKDNSVHDETDIAQLRKDVTELDLAVRPPRDPHAHY